MPSVVNKSLVVPTHNVHIQHPNKSVFIITNKDNDSNTESQVNNIQ